VLNSRTDIKDMPNSTQFGSYGNVSYDIASLASYIHNFLCGQQCQLRYSINGTYCIYVFYLAHVILLGMLARLQELP